MQERRRDPLSEDHRLLGRLLRTARERSGVTTRKVAEYSSGHISNVENGHATPSRELVEHYITTYGCERGRTLHLYDKVRNWAAQKRRQGRYEAIPPPSRPVALSEDSPTGDIRSSYRLTEVESYYRLDEARVIREMTSIRRISALYPGVSLVVVRVWYLTDPRPSKLSIEAGTGCSVAKLRTNSAGNIAAVLRLPQTLDPADQQPHALAFRVHYEGDVPASPLIWHRGHALLSRYSIRIQFHESMQPEQVWQFRGHSSMTAFEADTHESLHPSPSTFYFSDFFDIEEETVGIAWEW